MILLLNIFIIVIINFFRTFFLFGCVILNLVGYLLANFIMYYKSKAMDFEILSKEKCTSNRVYENQIREDFVRKMPWEGWIYLFLINIIIADSVHISHIAVVVTSFLYLEKRIVNFVLFSFVTGTSI